MAFTAVQLQQLIAQDLAQRERDHTLRTRRVATPISAKDLRIGDRRYVNFASNNYLGLTHHPRVIEAAAAALRSHGVGSGAAALISGYSPLHQAAEQAIAHWKSFEAAVLLPSGYQANLAAVQTLAALGQRSGGIRFLIDKLVHASLIDAVRASGQEWRVFPHNHIGKLTRLLREAPGRQMQVVVTESIFSMDGDAADLRAIVALKRELPLVLLLDEAHACGVYGPAGSGYAAELGVTADVDVSVVTLSKALGCAGGAVCGSAAFCDALINHGRAYIYSTSVPPATAAAAQAAIAVMRDEPQRQARLRELSRRVRVELAARCRALIAGDGPIIPIILGAEATALAESARLLEAGLLVPAVRPPTVPRGTSRLRISLCCEHTDEDVARLIEQFH